MSKNLEKSVRATTYPINKDKMMPIITMILELRKNFPKLRFLVSSIDMTWYRPYDLEWVGFPLDFFLSFHVINIEVVINQFRWRSAFQRLVSPFAERSKDLAVSPFSFRTLTRKRYRKKFDVLFRMNGLLRGRLTTTWTTMTCLKLVAFMFWNVELTCKTHAKTMKDTILTVKLRVEFIFLWNSTFIFYSDWWLPFNWFSFVSIY